MAAAEGFEGGDDAADGCVRQDGSSWESALLTESRRAPESGLRPGVASRSRLAVHALCQIPTVVARRQSPLPLVALRLPAGRLQTPTKVGLLPGATRGLVAYRLDACRLLSLHHIRLQPTDGHRPAQTHLSL